MRSQIEDTDDLSVIRCFACHGTGEAQGRRCTRCDRTGKVFWVGKPFPYTPAGETDARKHLRLYNGGDKRSAPE